MEQLTKFEQKIEDDIKKQITEYSYYAGDREEYTLDGEWSQSELEEDLDDEALRLVNDWKEKNKYRAVLDKDLLFPEYLANKVKEENDLIVVYNKAYDKHRNDADRKFGIHYFDEEIVKIMKKILKENLVTK